MTEITIVKPKPLYCFWVKLRSCKYCGCRPIAYLAKDEFGDFLYPLFCSNKHCEASYSRNAQTFSMMTISDWNNGMAGFNRPVKRKKWVLWLFSLFSGVSDD